MKSEPVPKAAPRRKPARPTSKGTAEPARKAKPEPVAGTWVLQAEAAARTGYSVSAIRKWRRAGVIADRKKVTPTGVERVEVRLEDVQARVAQQPPAASRPSPDPSPSGSPGPADQEIGPPPGSVIVLLTDLESLFGRVTEAERRAERAESRLSESQVETRYMSGQLAELRRQVQAASILAPVADAFDHRAEPALRVAPAAPVGPGRREGVVVDRPPAVTRPVDPSPVDRPPAAARPIGDEPLARNAPAHDEALHIGPRNGSRPVPPPSRTVPADLPDSRPRSRPAPPFAPPPPARAPEGGGSDDRGAARSRPSPAATPPAATAATATATKLDALALELRRLYARLDDYRREPTISPARERQRERLLGEYDTVLLRACSALSIPVGLRAGEPITVARRGALTHALATAGLDVRATPMWGRGQR